MQGLNIFNPATKRECVNKFRDHSEQNVEGKVEETGRKVEESGSFRKFVKMPSNHYP